MKIVITNHDGGALALTFTTPDNGQETISLATGKKVVWPIGSHHDPFGSLVVPRGAGWTFLVEKVGDGILKVNDKEIPPEGLMFVRRPTEAAYALSFSVVAEPTMVVHKPPPTKQAPEPKPEPPKPRPILKVARKPGYKPAPPPPKPKPKAKHKRTH